MEHISDSFEVRKLLDEGKRKGVLTYEEICETLSQQEDIGVAEIEDLLQTFVDAGIEVVEKVKDVDLDCESAALQDEDAPVRDVGAQDELFDTWDRMPIDDYAQMWLRHLGEAPLLTTSGERPFHKPTDEEDARTSEASTVKEKLTRANLGRVVSIAKQYSGRGMSFPDLIQEGSIGLIRAIETFDCKKGYDFGTYADLCIRWAIAHALFDCGRTIRLPIDMLKVINRLVKTSSRLLQELGREPTLDELACETQVPVELVSEIYRLAPEPLSLETLIGEDEDSDLAEGKERLERRLERPLIGGDEDSDLADFIEDRERTFSDEVLSPRVLREQIVELLSQLLTDRECSVLLMRFGLVDGYPKTTVEVARHFHLHRSSVCRIEKRALKKLRDAKRCKDLEEYLA